MTLFKCKVEFFTQNLPSNIQEITQLPALVLNVSLWQFYGFVKILSQGKIISWHTIIAFIISTVKSYTEPSKNMLPSSWLILWKQEVTIELCTRFRLNSASSPCTEHSILYSKSCFYLHLCGSSNNMKLNKKFWHFYDFVRLLWKILKKLINTYVLNILTLSQFCGTFVITHKLILNVVLLGPLS